MECGALKKGGRGRAITPFTAATSRLKGAMRRPTFQYIVNAAAAGRKEGRALVPDY